MSSNAHHRDDDIVNLKPTIMHCLCQEFRRRKNNQLTTEVEIEYSRQEFFYNVKKFKSIQKCHRMNCINR